MCLPNRVKIPVAGLLAAMAASGQVYRWTDSTGKVHYGDRPPEEAKARELRIQSYDGPVEVQDWSGVLRGKTMPGSGPGLTMYATSWCGYCKRARAYFAQKNIRTPRLMWRSPPRASSASRSWAARACP
jgi:thiol-disulfide isomerase/thioredoxin